MVLNVGVTAMLSRITVNIVDLKQGYETTDWAGKDVYLNTPSFWHHSANERQGVRGGDTA